MHTPCFNQKFIFAPSQPAVLIFIVAKKGIYGKAVREIFSFYSQLCSKKRGTGTHLPLPRLGFTLRGLFLTFLLGFHLSDGVLAGKVDTTLLVDFSDHNKDLVTNGDYVLHLFHTLGIQL